MKTARNVVAIDTNICLHFRSINEIDPKALGFSSPIAWLVPMQVVDELDAQKTTGDKRLRERAKSALRMFERVRSGEMKLGHRGKLLMHERAASFDFASFNLDRQAPDNLIIADIKDFESQSLGTVVTLLADDYGIRYRASQRGIKTLEPPESLRLPELDDARDVRLRIVEERNRVLEERFPNLSLIFENGEGEAALNFGELQQDELDEFIRLGAQPDPILDTALVRSMMGFAAAFTQPNPKYEEQLEVYVTKLRAFINASWKRDYRTLSISPVLLSSNGTQADNVEIELRFETNAEIVEERAPEPERPFKPEPETTTMPPFYGVTQVLSAQRSWQGMIDSQIYRERYAVPRSTGPSIQQSGRSVFIRYWERSVRQEDTTALDPFFLYFADDVVLDESIDIVYEIRGTNMNGVARGALIVRCSSEPKPIPALYLWRRARADSGSS